MSDQAAWRNCKEATQWSAKWLQLYTETCPQTYCEVIMCSKPCWEYNFFASLASVGSLDVPPHANEAGEPSHTKQRPLGAGFCPSPPGQEASPATL